MRLPRFFPLILASVLLCSCGADPIPATPSASLKFFLGDAALVMAQQLVNPVLVKELTNMTLPDVSWSGVGIHLSLTDMLMTSFALGPAAEQTVSFSPPSTVVVKMTGISAAIRMNWEYKDGPAIDWTGWALDSISDSSLVVKLVARPASAANGTASLLVDEVDFDIGDLDIQLHGDGGKLFQFFANVVKPLIKSKAEDAVQSTMASKLNEVLSWLFGTAIPTRVSLWKNVSLDFGLVRSTAVHGLQGKYYSDNHFSGDESAVYYSELDHHEVTNYRSFDVTTYFRPPVDLPYRFQLHETQRGEINVGGESAGSLEMHNPGMCWPESAHHTTDTIFMNASLFYPMRVRYQSGCGGGWVTLRVCPGANSDCTETLDTLNMTTAPERDLPLTVWPQYLEVSSALHAVLGKNDTTPPPGDALVGLSDFPPNPTAMATGLIDEFALNSLLFKLAEAGLFSAHLNNSQVPSASPFKLNTTSWKFLLPDLYAKYPNDLMALDLFAPTPAVNPPSVSVSAANQTLNIRAPLAVNVSVVLANETSVGVFGLGLNVSAELVASFVDNASNASNATSPRLVANIKALDIALDKRWTTIKLFDIASFEKLVNAIVQSAVLPGINAKLAKGFELPMLGPLAFSNTALELQNRVIVLSSDLRVVGGGAATFK